MTALRLTQTFTIIWTPQAKQRARTVVHDGRVATYTPKSTVDTEAMIRAVLVERGAFMYPTGVPVELVVTFGVRRPKDSPRRELWPPRRPDLVNYLALLADAGTSVLWADDSQLVTVACTKQVMTTPQLVLTCGVPCSADDHQVPASSLMAWERWVLDREK